jgi:MYXO-CTERM domain-containing protein
VTGGYMPDAKTFIIAPYSGMVPGEPKNSLFVSFVPGWTPSIPPPDDGDDPVDPGEDPPSGGDSGDDDPGGDPGEPPPPSSPGLFGGCALAAGGPGGPGALAVLALGLALIPVVRRRRGR